MKAKSTVKIRVTQRSKENDVDVEVHGGSDVQITVNSDFTTGLDGDKEPVFHPWKNQPGYDC